MWATIAALFVLVRELARGLEPLTACLGLAGVLAQSSARISLLLSTFGLVLVAAPSGRLARAEPRGGGQSDGWAGRGVEPIVEHESPPE
jgi:hypothetical protein